MRDAAVDGLPDKPLDKEIVAAFLLQEGWPVEEVGEGALLKSAVKMNNGEWICYAHFRPQERQTLFYSVAPLRVPPVLLAAVAEYLTRANWGLVMGNFELDYSDGEVRFKTSIQLDKALLTDDLLRPLVMGNVLAMDKYLPGLQAVVALQMTPVEAIATVEAS
jgi:hypothetical protein